MNFIDGKALGLDENITYGIRPEKMLTGGSITKEVKIDITELLGSEKIVYFNIGNSKCSAKLPPDYNISENIVLSINEKDLYRFDKSGNRIY